MNGYEKVNLDTLNSGAASLLFQDSWEKAWDNIRDENIPSKTPRKIVLEITLLPDDKREKVKCIVKCDAKLPGIAPHEQNAYWVQGQPMQAPEGIQESLFESQERIVGVK